MIHCVWYVVAVSLAIQRDGSSGGVVRLAVITKDGVKREVVLPHEQPPSFRKE